MERRNERGKRVSALTYTMSVAFSLKVINKHHSTTVFILAYLPYSYANTHTHTHTPCGYF